MGIAAGDLAEKTMEAVDASGRRQKHEGALSGHNLNASVVAEGDRTGAGRATAGGAVHPHPMDPSFDTVADDRISDDRRGHEERSIDRRLNVLQASEAVPTLYIRGVRIYRNDVVAAAAELFKELDAEASRFTRDPDHGNSLLSEEILNGFQRKTLSGQAVLPSRAWPAGAVIIDYALDAGSDGGHRNREAQSPAYVQARLLARTAVCAAKAD